jgi:hypothetical protein
VGLAEFGCHHRVHPDVCLAAVVGVVLHLLLPHEEQK